MAMDSCPRALIMMLARRKRDAVTFGSVVDFYVPSVTHRRRLAGRCELMYGTHCVIASPLAKEENRQFSAQLFEK